METKELKSEVKKPTQPWKPASYLNVPKELRKPGFRLRWVVKDQLEKKKEEGWTPVVRTGGRANALAPEKTVIDGTQIDTTVQKRTLILCEMPEETAKAREEFFAKLTEDSVEAMKNKFVEETTVPGHGSRAYGSVKIEVGK